MTANGLKANLGQKIALARLRKGLSWEDIANAIGKDPVWTVSALLGQHPVPADIAAKVIDLLDINSPDAALILTSQPYRGGDDDMAKDPTIYRFYEALSVYGPALKELIHEEFGDGIMSAINFQVDLKRRPDPSGDRVVVTFDGKFLDYAWNHSKEK